MADEQTAPAQPKKARKPRVRKPVTLAKVFARFWADLKHWAFGR